MIWFFAVLIVLAVGGIAIVAAGHGAPLSPSYDDRADASVPEEGPLTSEDLLAVRFTSAFRGYNASEVDALLARLAREREVPHDLRLPHPPEGPTQP